jgi:hypothetical protein
VKQRDIVKWLIEVEVGPDAPLGTAAPSPSAQRSYQVCAEGPLVHGTIELCFVDTSRFVKQWNGVCVLWQLGRN